MILARDKKQARTIFRYVRALLTGVRRIAMEYSPGCAIPYVARVDAGTIELVRWMGAEVVSSGDLIQRFSAAWDAAAIATQPNLAEAHNNQGNTLAALGRAEHHFIDALMERIVEIFRLQDGGHPLDGAIVHKDRAEQCLLDLDVIGDVAIGFLFHFSSAGGRLLAGAESSGAKSGEQV
jgi:hypothetical protein